MERTRMTSVEPQDGEKDIYGFAACTLEEAILREGKNLGGGILKVNSIINHRVDVELMDLCGRALADRFLEANVSLVLTAQTSGVLPAQACARWLKVPLVFAREKKPLTMDGAVYEAKSKSHTRASDVSLFVAAEFITSHDRVLVVDDFLASGTTAVALYDIIKQAGATGVGMCFLIEKSFEGGRDFVLNALCGDDKGMPIASLVDVTSLDDDGKIRTSTRS